MYKFIEFENRETSILTEEDYAKVEKELKELVSSCAFICTWYGHMYPTDGATVSYGHRGPVLQTKDDSGFDWYYRVSGGYKLEG